MLKLELNPDLLEAGCDEAGRGCLAGPVYAAAVILPKSFNHPLLNDSKKMTEKHRQLLRSYIIEHSISWAVASVDNKTIDSINILKASILSMHKAISKLNPVPEFLLIDGNKFDSYNNIPHKTIIKGDAIYSPIAAASVLAKTFRDNFMIQLDKKYSNFNWKKNKGYPTKEHKKNIITYGLTKYHRQTFCKFYFDDTIN